MTAKNVRMGDESVSHHISLVRYGNPQGAIDKEEIDFTFHGEWRGENITFRMTARRYRHSSGLSEWSVYGGNGYYGDEFHGFGLKPLSETAEDRLRPIARPMVAEWLASEHYVRSFRARIANVVKGMAYDLKPYGDSPTHDVRVALSEWRETMGDANAVLIEQMCDAYDTFARLYNKELS